MLAADSLTLGILERSKGFVAAATPLLLVPDAAFAFALAGLLVSY